MSEVRNIPPVVRLVQLLHVPVVEAVQPLLPIGTGPVHDSCSEELSYTPSSLLARSEQLIAELVERESTVSHSNGVVSPMERTKRSFEVQRDADSLRRAVMWLRLLPESLKTSISQGHLQTAAAVAASVDTILRCQIESEEAKLKYGLPWQEDPTEPLANAVLKRALELVSLEKFEADNMHLDVQSPEARDAYVVSVSSNLGGLSDSHQAELRRLDVLCDSLRQEVVTMTHHGQTISGPLKDQYEIVLCEQLADVVRDHWRVVLTHAKYSADDVSNLPAVVAFSPDMHDDQIDPLIDQLVADALLARGITPGLTEDLASVSR